MSLIALADARARGIALPSDDAVAQDIIDEQEAWLARRIGPLEGDRTETFYTGLAATHGKLGLARYTDAVTVTDGGSAVDAANFRLVDNGSAIVFTYQAPSRWWTGPYVAVTYEPNDVLEVQRVLYGLLSIEAAGSVGTGAYESERIGDYSYTRATGAGASTPASERAALASSLLPKRDALTTLYAVSRRLGYGDPVINHPEPEWPW